MEVSFGPYQLLEQFAAGGVGAVHRGRDLRDGSEVAIKVLIRPTAQRMGRFELEAEALRRVQHPNVVPVREFGIASDGRPYLVMDLIQGQTLQRRLDTQGPLPASEAVEVAQQIAAALVAAHRAGLLHRDVKPENVLLRASDGAAILGDFGLAKELGEQLQRLTQTGSILGTPGYLAPEQLGASAKHGPPTDVYGFGATLYAMLTGEPPCVGSTALEAFQATISKPPVPPSNLAPVPRALNDLCLRCLAKDPQRRYPDASALFQALGQLSPRAQSASSEGSASSGRAPKAPLVLLGATILGGVAGWFLTLPDSSLPASPTPSTATSPLESVPFQTSPSQESPADPLGESAESPPPASAAQTGAALSPSSTRGLSPPSREFSDLLRRCERLLESRDPGAAELVRRAHALAPESPRTKLFLGIVLLREGKPAQALPHVEGSIELDSTRPNAFLARAQIRLVRGQLSEAKVDLKRAISLNPKLHAAWANLGVLHKREGDLPSSLSALNRALQIKSSPSALVSRAQVYFGLRKLRLARADADRAVRDDPNLGAAWAIRGAIKEALGDRSCLEDLDRALSINPEDLVSRSRRSSERTRRGDFAGVVADTTRFLKEAGNPAGVRAQDAVLRRALAHAFLGDLASSASDLELLLNRVPGHPAAIFWQGELYFRQGQFEKASERYQDSLRATKVSPQKGGPQFSRRPSASTVHAALGRIHHLQGRQEASLASFQRAIENADRRDPYPRLWAMALFEEREVVETWPDPDPWPKPIREYLLGRLSEVEILALAAKSPRYTCQVRAYLGMEAERKGRLKSAHAHYRAAIATGSVRENEYTWSELRLR